MSEVTTTSTTAISEDTPCCRCGYNLRGLAPTGLCPECGTAIAHSISGILLKHADPKWLRRLRFGISLKLWSIVLVVVVAVAVQSAAPTIVLIVGSALVLCPTFLITSQEPRIALQEDPITLRKALRVCAVVGFVGFVGDVISNAGTTGTWAVVADRAGAVVSLVGLFVPWGELLYFRRFAHRIPDLKLAKSTTLLMWGGPITGGLLIGLGAVLSPYVSLGFAGERRDDFGTRLVTCFFWAFGLFLLLLLVWYVLLLIKYRKAFRQAASKSHASVILQPEV